MKLALLATILLFTPEPVIMTGWASQYGKGVMPRVVRFRQARGQLTAFPLDEFDGFVAAQECADIGKVIYLRPIGRHRWEKFLIADCASKSDRQSESDPRSGWQWMRDGDILVEVDYQTALRWNTVGRGIKIEMRRVVPKIFREEWQCEPRQIPL